MVDKMEQGRIQKIGDRQGLHLSIEWLADDLSGTLSKITWGNCLLWIGDELVWGIQDDDCSGQFVPVQWDWVQLLEFLCDAWPYILYEEHYPINISSGTPELLHTEAQKRWDNMSESLALDEAQELYYFESVHDLSKGLDGMHVPPVFLLREGRNMWVGTKNHYVQRPIRETIDTLAVLGDAIIERVNKLPGNARAELIKQRWIEKAELSLEKRIELTTGLSDAQQLQLARSYNTKGDFWGLSSALDGFSDVFGGTELLAAARMTSDRLNIECIERILSAIKTVKRGITPALDKLSQEALIFMQPFECQPFYEQGYRLASWLREKQSIVLANGKVNPEKLLCDWGVYIKELSDISKEIEAVACWGQQHGPAILLNPAGIHNKNPSGKRATYAHEICHLLIDRQGALPLAEVLGGRLPDRAEQRAKAFAAELLLPREKAASAVQEITEPKKLLNHLDAKYGVSHQIAANQVLNSDANIQLSKEMRIFLEGYRNVF